MRDQIVTRLTTRIAGSDTLSARERAELAGQLRTKAAFNRFLRTTPRGLLRVNQAAVRQDANFDGKFLLHGFRNRDICRRIFSPARSAQERRRASGRTTRLLRLLRAHGLIRKVSHTFNYRVTNKGQRLMATALKLRQTCFLALAS